MKFPSEIELSMSLLDKMTLGLPSKFNFRLLQQTPYNSELKTYGTVELTLYGFLGEKLTMNRIGSGVLKTQGVISLLALLLWKSLWQEEKLNKSEKTLDESSLGIQDLRDKSFFRSYLQWKSRYTIPEGKELLAQIKIYQKNQRYMNGISEKTSRKESGQLALF